MEEIIGIGNNIDEVVKSYKTYLEVKYPDHLEGLIKREKSNLDGVRLEAAIFSIARHYRLNPTIGEIIGQGGVDFLCQSDDDQFAIEVTHLDTESAERKSGISSTPETGGAFSFSMITDALQAKAIDKAEQMAGYSMPRVLVIGSTHIASPILLGKHAARDLMTSDTKISIPIEKTTEESKIVTDLKESVFFKPNASGEIEPCRRSISAILLVTLDCESCLIVGLLHPDPAYPFKISCLSDFPFLRVSNWPCLNGVIETEWVIHNPEERRCYLHKIELQTDELRQK